MMSNLPPDGFADEQNGPPDGFADEGSQGTPSIGQTVKSLVTDNPAYQFNPVMFGNRAQEFVTNTFDRGGEMAAEALAKGAPNRSSVNPNVAAAAGTAISMVPDVAMSFSPAPIFGKGAKSAAVATEQAPSFLRSFAQQRGAKALGFTKRFLKDPKKASQARETAQVMLDEGVITPFASAETIAERAAETGQRSGKRIGEYLASIDESGRFFDPSNAIQELNSMRPTQAPMGAYKKIHEKIDNAIETIKAHGDQPIPFAEANKLKGTLQDLANWASNKDATILDKSIAGKFRGYLDNELERVSGQVGKKEGFDQFKRDKKIFAASQRAEDPIFNRISSEQGNNFIGLDEMVLAAPQMAGGGFGVAALTGLLFRGLKRFGNQGSAVLANKMAKTWEPALKEAAKRGPNALAEAHNELMARDPDYMTVIKNASRKPSPTPMFKKASAVPLALGLASSPDTAEGETKNLTKDKAREYLDKANGDRDMARKLAQQDGYTWQKKPKK